MKTSLFLVFGAFVCVSVNGQGDTTTQPPTFAPPTPPPSTTSTSTPSTTTSTTPSTTTTTSTAAPSTTTAAPPTTSTPTPKFPANEGKWNVKNGSTVCIMMKGAIEASLAYVDADKKNQVGNVDVPKSAVASGVCGKDSQSITLSWNTTVSENFTEVNKLTFVFETNTTKTDTQGSEISSGKFALTNVTGVIYKDSVAFPNATDRGTPIEIDIINQATFQTPFNYSYACLAEETVKSSDGVNIVKLRDIRFEAFKTSATAEFSSPIQCPADDSSDVVPIAVGAALAGLVVIVLLAYLIGRRRSRARGYQSV